MKATKITDRMRIDLLEAICRSEAPQEPFVMCDRWGPMKGQFSIELDTKKKTAKRYKDFRKAIDAAIKKQSKQDN